MKFLALGLWLVFFTKGVVIAKIRHPFVLDQRFICNIKRTCVECLRLSHCSWCETESRCYSKQLPIFQDFCKNDTIEYKDNGLSLEENAKCSCGGSEIESKCYAPHVTEGTVCSGRGNCVCGHCICDTNPDPEHSSKNIVGEFCEFDTCNGSHCKEGRVKTNEDNSSGAVEVEQPLVV